MGFICGGVLFLYQIPFGVTGYKNVTHKHTEHSHISFHAHTTLAGYKNVTHIHIEHQPSNLPIHNTTGYKNVTHRHTEHPHISFHAHATLTGYKNVTRRHMGHRHFITPHTPHSRVTKM